MPNFKQAHFFVKQKLHKKFDFTYECGGLRQQMSLAEKKSAKNKTWINYSFASVEPWLQYSKDIICTAASSKRLSRTALSGLSTN